MRDRPKSVVSLIGGFKEGSGSNMSMVCGSVQSGPVRYRTPSSRYVCAVGHVTALDTG